MPKKSGTMNWPEPSNDKNSESFNTFCLELFLEKEKKALTSGMNEFSSATDTAAKHLEKLVETISSLPLLSTILFWIEKETKDTFTASRHAQMMKELISEGFIGIKDNKGNLWTLKHMVSIGHDSIIEAIRCNDVWPIEKTESYVKFYIDFVNWLSEKSLGYVPKASDPIMERIRWRKLPYNYFIAITQKLSSREQVISQLLYFGGTRTLEEILTLKIEDISLSSGHIILSKTPIPFPKHVLKNLKAYTDGRKKGLVFIGKRQGEKLDPTLPYRALKTVVSKLDLDPSFTFKDFVRDV